MLGWCLERLNRSSCHVQRHFCGVCSVYSRQNAVFGRGERLRGLGVSCRGSIQGSPRTAARRAAGGRRGQPACARSYILHLALRWYRATM